MFMGGEVKLNFSDSTERSGVDPLSESSPFIAFMFISYSPRVRQLTGWSSKSLAIGSLFICYTARSILRTRHNR